MSVDFVCVRACTYTNRKGSSCGLKAVLGFVASKSLAEFGMFTTRCAIAHETVLLSFCEVVWDKQGQVQFCNFLPYIWAIFLYLNFCLVNLFVETDQPSSPFLVTFAAPLKYLVGVQLRFSYLKLDSIQTQPRLKHVSSGSHHCLHSVRLDSATSGASYRLAISPCTCIALWHEAAEQP